MVQRLTHHTCRQNRFATRAGTRQQNGFAVKRHLERGATIQVTSQDLALSNAS
uniref:Uncharacterized protein n=1 Tax=Arundo donax TaxID=35708 RepID=A0A0A9CV89_ARUDO